MRISSRPRLLRFGTFVMVIGAITGAYWFGHQSGIAFGYNRGYLFGYFACRESDAMMNVTPAHDIHIPHEQVVREGIALHEQLSRHNLAAFNDRYLDPEFVANDRLVVHYEESPR